MKTWACIARFGGVGDNLIATTVLPALKNKYDFVEVMTNRPFGIVFENNPNIDKLTYIDEKDFPNQGAEEWQKWFVLRAKEYDYFAHLSHTVEMELAFFYGQAKFWRPVEFRRKLADHNYLEFAHDWCGLPYHPIGARYYPTEEEIALAQQDKVEKLLNGSGSGRPLIGYVCSGTRIDKHHPLAGIVLARLISELGATVALFGGWQKDRQIAEQVESQVRKHNRTLDGLRDCLSTRAETDPYEKADGIWPLRRSLAQLQQCDLVITLDTGPGWAVSMVPIPKILIVSHASAKNIGKHWVDTTILQANPERVPCHPCHRLHGDISTCVPNFDGDGVACTSDVSVEAIVRCAKLWITDKDEARNRIKKTMTTDEVMAEVDVNPKRSAASIARLSWGSTLQAAAE